MNLKQNKAPTLLHDIDLSSSLSAALLTLMFSNMCRDISSTLEMPIL